jgi:hypothetical protein
VNQRNAEELTNEKEGRDCSYWENPGWYSLWDSSEISLKQGPSSGWSFSVKNPYFLSKW